MKDKITSIFFAGLLILLSLFNILLPEKTFSNKENRYLSKFPNINREDIISGKFADDFNDYSSDQFIGRDYWISLKTGSDLALLKNDNGRVYFGRDNYLFRIDQPLDRYQYGKNIDTLNIFLERMERERPEAKVYALLVPSKARVLGDYLPIHAPHIDEEEIIEDLRLSLRDNIKLLDPSSYLEERSDEYIYYRTDHHWTSEGAFYAYNYFLQSKGERALDPKDFIIEEVTGEFLGTNYRKANLYLGERDRIHLYLPRKEIEKTILVNQQERRESYYDKSFLDKRDKYSYFFGGDQGIIEIETSLEEGKNILIFKDSFANSLIPLMEGHYKSITVIDPRYFRANPLDFMEDKDIDEVLFLFNTQSFIQEKDFTIFRK